LQLTPEANRCRVAVCQSFAEPVQQAFRKTPISGLLETARRVSRRRFLRRTGDINGAIEDFQLFICQTDNEKKRSQRQRWVTALRAREDPFTPDEIEKLRK